MVKEYCLIPRHSIPPTLPVLGRDNANGSETNATITTHDELPAPSTGAGPSLSVSTPPRELTCTFKHPPPPPTPATPTLLFSPSPTGCEKDGNSCECSRKGGAVATMLKRARAKPRAVLLTSTKPSAHTSRMLNPTTTVPNAIVKRGRPRGSPKRDMSNACSRGAKMIKASKKREDWAINNSVRKSNIERSSLNPPLTHLLATVFTDVGEKEAAEGILQWMRNRPEIKWNEDGIIYKPVSGLSLISYLRYMVQGENSFTGFKLTSTERILVKILNSIIPIPKAMISGLSSAGEDLYLPKSPINKIVLTNWVKY